MREHLYRFPIANRVFDQADLLDRMMSRTGVDPVVAIRSDGGASWREARSRCIDCAADRLCRDWLDAAPCNGPLHVPTFCPNGEFFKACLQGEPEAPVSKGDLSKK